ncbi:hypothetical protein BD311DRAFT_50917 [Dichomitus squalens]|uniref:Uncharacterized protein n=1 Tax=Dichomitus squalens TaxID=114155 RepID=A0A4Q9N034_9APHY|nr:hypothetical protein BD311DRAFT_50917 [Dichomitus squalens]
MANTMRDFNHSDLPDVECDVVHELSNAIRCSILPLCPHEVIWILTLYCCSDQSLVEKLAPKDHSLGTIRRSNALSLPCKLQRSDSVRRSPFSSVKIRLPSYLILRARADKISVQVATRGASLPALAPGCAASGPQHFVGVSRLRGVSLPREMVQNVPRACVSVSPSHRLLPGVAAPSSWTSLDSDASGSS